MKILHLMQMIKQRLEKTDIEIICWINQTYLTTMKNKDKKQ